MYIQHKENEEERKWKNVRKQISLKTKYLSEGIMCLIYMANSKKSILLEKRTLSVIK